jgi:hypothetical protein
MGPTTLSPLQKKAHYRFLSPLKIDHPWQGLNPWALGLLMSTITITLKTFFLTNYDASFKLMVSGYDKETTAWHCGNKAFF